MTKHRRPPDRVSNDIHHDNPDNPNLTDALDNSDTPNPTEAPDNPNPSTPNPTEIHNNPDNHHPTEAPDNPDSFDPAEALQSLHLEIVQIEAIANAASEAVVQLPFPLGREDRRVFDRVYALVTKVADEIDAAVRHGDKLIAALSAHLRRRHPEP